MKTRYPSLPAAKGQEWQSDACTRHVGVWAAPKNDPVRGPYYNIGAAQQGGLQEQPHPRLLDVRQLSAYLALPVPTIYTWASLRRIPSDCIVHLGRSLRFDREAVDRWVSRQSVAAAQAGTSR